MSPPTVDVHGDKEVVGLRPISCRVGEYSQAWQRWIAKWKVLIFLGILVCLASTGGGGFVLYQELQKRKEGDGGEGGAEDTADDPDAPGVEEGAGGVVQEAISTPVFAAQVKFHAVVLRGVRIISEAP